MRDVDYGLRDFHPDMVICFPELVLYLAGTGIDGLGSVETSENLVLGTEGVDVAGDDGVSLTNMTGSGRTGIDEYKRTIGALFAVYWLMRLQLPGVPNSETLDGQRGFCFGVNTKHPGKRS